MARGMFTLLAGLVLLAGQQSLAGDLSVGDPAPKLELKEFVKGDPVSGLEKNKIYVIEFWATWCGPCKASIPHLTDLQKKYKDITFIGVSVLEEDPKDVKPFVDMMGDKMAYRVALDSVPEGQKGDMGKMAQNWMTAAGQEGIPTAFVVNGEGKIAWIGHPMQMDKPLEQIAGGKYDLQAAAAEFKKEQARLRKLQELQAKLEKAQKAGDNQKTLEVIDQAIAEDASLEANLALPRFFVLAEKKENHPKALEYGNKLVEKIYKDDANGLNNLSWSILEQNEKSEQFIKLALQAAQRADELTMGKDAAVKDTLALAYFESGNKAKAIETQELAVQLDKGKDPDLKKRLEKYKKANKQ